MMAHGDARERKWRGTWRMEWVASTLHTTSDHGVSSITTADALTSAASIRLNWSPRRFKLTRPFRRKTKSVFCACAITFQMQSTTGFHETHEKWHNSLHLYLPVLILSVNNRGVWSHKQFILFLICGDSLALKENKNGKRLERNTPASITICETSSTTFTILPKNWHCYLIVSFGCA